TRACSIAAIEVARAVTRHDARDRHAARGRHVAARAFGARRIVDAPGRARRVAVARARDRIADQRRAVWLAVRVGRARAPVGVARAARDRRVRRRAGRRALALRLGAAALGALATERRALGRRLVGAEAAAIDRRARALLARIDSTPRVEPAIGELEPVTPA